MAKNKDTWGEWQRLYYAERDLTDRRGEALARVWMVIESEVADAGLANSLRMAVIGDVVPDVMVYQAEELEDDDVEEMASDDE